MPGTYRDHSTLVKKSLKHQSSFANLQQAVTEIFYGISAIYVDSKPGQTFVIYIHMVFEQVNITLACFFFTFLFSLSRLFTFCFYTSRQFKGSHFTVLTPMITSVIYLITKIWNRDINLIFANYTYNTTNDFF